MTPAKKLAQAATPYLTAGIMILAVWSLVVAILQVPATILPSPSLVGSTFVKVSSSGELFKHALISLARVTVAWFISLLAAVPLGLLMGYSRNAEKIVDPFVELLRPISPLAWIPMAILWFGIGEAGKVFVILIATFFPILLNTIEGVKRVEPVLIRAGRVLGCESNLEIFRRVILPAALPSIIVGMRISFGTGWAAIIAAELVAAKIGLGFLIANGMEILRSDLVFVGMITIGIIGVCIDSIFRSIQSRLA